MLDSLAVVAEVSPVDPLVVSSAVVATGQFGAMKAVSLTTSMSHGLQAVRVARKMEAEMVCRMARNLARQTDQPQAKITSLLVSEATGYLLVTR